MDYDALLHETRLATLPSSRASGQQREALKQVTPLAVALPHGLHLPPGCWVPGDAG